MADVILSIDVDTYEAEEYFTYAGYKARDMEEPLESVLYNVILPGVQEQFDTAGSRVGGWKPLDPNWVKYKERHGYSTDILIMTGMMKDEMLGYGTDRAWHITRDVLYYEPDDHKVILHQLGGWEPGKPPQRQIVVITADDLDQIEDIFADWLDELRTFNIRRGEPDPSIRPMAPTNIYVEE